MKSAPRYLVVLTLVLTLGCGGSGGDFNLISVEEEWQLGNQLAADIARHVRVRNDPTGYLDRVGQRIVSQTPYANMPWQFHLVDDPEINAFAIPGGHVYIHTGLINAARNSSEVAGVMAHEISHVVARHSTEQMSRQYGLQILAGLALGQNPGQIQQIATAIVAQGALARYSRDAETEADRLGARYMNDAGYDPRGMVTMFQTLIASRQSRPGAVEQFFSTHPLTEDRIRRVESEIAQLERRSANSDEAAFQQLKNSV
jgi:beta-barrel assembly-enhancing protease